MYLLMSAFSTIGINIDFETFWNEFKEGLGLYISKDIKQTILEVADFLGKKITDEELDTLENHLKIDNFRKNKSVNNDHLKVLGLMKNLNNSFIRKGKVGGWRDYFSDNLNVEADIWIEENLKDTDLELKTVLKVPSTV
ncbi:Sulfotransfer 1 domain containing protein, partial [Asbolus verrucosus]